MNQGGEPAHDDYGLPPVDIEIPDDARELDRDVQAYQRELRALRRRERSNRWRAPLRRSGMLVPLLAGCLILAMVAGMVLTMFSANPYFSGPGGRGGPAPQNSPQSSSRAGASSAPAAQAKGSGGAGSAQAARLPAGDISSVAGRPISLRGLNRVALAIIPVNCRCVPEIGQLLRQARLAKVPVYLVGERGVNLGKLAGASAGGKVVLASDAHNVLRRAYQTAGPVVVLVNARHDATVESLKPGLRLEQQLKALRQPHQRAAPSGS